MERITCLQSIFTRKNKVKVTTADRIETIKFGVDESSNKVPRFEGGGFHEEPSTTYVEIRTHDSSVRELIMAPSISKWGKEGSACAWSDNEDLEAAELLTKMPDVISKFEGFHFPISQIVEEDRLQSFPQCAAHADVGVEVAYEGGDEDGDSAGASYMKERESDPSSSEDIVEVVGEDTAPGDIFVNESTRYYETQSNGAARFTSGDDRHFSGGEIFLDVGNDYVSDPGVYKCKDLEMASIAYFDPGSKSGHHSEDAPVMEMPNGCLLGDPECGSQHLTSTMTGHQVIMVSGGSGSSAEFHKMDSSGAAVKSVWVRTSHSEMALRDAKDKILNVNFSEGGKKHRPWWKVFLFTHRNIHRSVPGVLSGVALNGRTGYGTEVDYCDGMPCPMFLPDQPDQDKTFVGDGNANGKASDINPEECVVDMDMSNFEAVTPPVPTSTLTMMTVMGRADRKLHVPEKPDLSRVEEWVSSTDFATVAVDEDIENDGQALREPGSPTASASTFFSKRVQSAPQLLTDGDGYVVHHNDASLGGDAERAAQIARSVDPLSTVAYFSGVGLRMIPPLALYNSLKTLNLSVNHIVHIMPGSLPRSLHSLDISHNRITAIEGLRDLTRLRVLNMSHNRISRIGHGLAGCSSLRELHLAGNKISEIEGLHRLLKLSFLDLSFNKLTTTKAISQLAANYHSLQALNLLGNALHSNLGDEPLRKLVTVLAPHILYLNKQAVKAVSARDAAVDSVARAAMGTANHHHTARGSKVTRGGLNVTPVAPTSQGKFRNGEKGSHPLHIVPGGHSRTSTVKETTRKQQQQQHHHSQQQHYQQHSGNKEHPLHSLGIQSSTPAMESRLVEGDVNRMVLASGKGKKHMKSGGSLFENDRNHQVYLLV